MAGKSPVQVTTEVWKRLQRSLMLQSQAAKESFVRVGVLKGEGAEEQDGITMTELAAIHEFGSPAAHIPQRSFIRSTFNRDDVRGEMKELVAKLTTKVIHGMALSQALGLLGAWGAAKVKDTIKQRLTQGPERQENAPSTIARKGSSLPLVDTGRMINAVSWLVQLGYARDEKGRFTGGERGGGLG